MSSFFPLLRPYNKDKKTGSLHLYPKLFQEAGKVKKLRGGILLMLMEIALVILA